MDTKSSGRSGFSADTQVVTIKYFFFASEAELYAARLRNEGVRCFVSNVNGSTALPVGTAGIGLHVRAEDAQLAARIVAQLDQMKRKRPDDVSFHDADHEDIEFEKQLHEQQQRRTDWIFYTVLLVVALLVLRAFLRAVGGFEQLRDAF